MCSHDSTNGPMCRASGRCRFPARVQPLWHQLSLSRRLLNGSVAPRAAPRLPPHFGSVRHPRMRRLDSECVISAAYAAAYDHVCLPHLGIVRLWGAVSDKLNPLRNTARGGGPKNKRVMHALLWTRPLKLKASQRTAPPPSRICSRRLKCHSNTSTGRRSSENRLVLLGQNS